MNVTPTTAVEPMAAASAVARHHSRRRRRRRRHLGRCDRGRAGALSRLVHTSGARDRLPAPPPLPARLHHTGGAGSGAARAWQRRRRRRRRRRRWSRGRWLARGRQEPQQGGKQHVQQRQRRWGRWGAVAARVEEYPGRGRGRCWKWRRRRRRRQRRLLALGERCEGGGTDGASVW